MFSVEQERLFRVLSECASAEKLQIYVVGGTVRDLLLGENPGDRDIDFLIEGDAIAFGERCVKLLKGELKKFPDFFTAKIIAPEGFGSIDEVDLASSRTELYKIPGALPTVSLAQIKDDLKRRDFTINAMAVPLDGLRRWGAENYGDTRSLSGITLDFFSGLEDLASRTVRILHSKSFIDDPTRIFRAVRYAVRLNGKLEEETEKAAVNAIVGGALNTISKTRAFNEIKKMVIESRTYVMIDELERLGVVSGLGLFPASGSALVRERLSKLKDKFPNLDSHLSFQSALRVFFTGALEGMSLDAAQELYLSFGFGKKEVAKMAMDTTVSLKELEATPSKIRRLTDAGIVFQSISNWPGECDIINRELESRGLSSK